MAFANPDASVGAPALTEPYSAPTATSNTVARPVEPAPVAWPSRAARSPRAELAALLSSASAAGLRGSDTAVLTALWSFASAVDGRCWPRLETIAARAAVSRRTVVNALARLEAAGLVVRRVPALVARRRLRESNTYELAAPQRRPQLALPLPRARSAALAPARAVTAPVTGHNGGHGHGHNGGHNGSHPANPQANAVTGVTGPVTPPAPPRAVTAPLGTRTGAHVGAPSPPLPSAPTPLSGPPSAGATSSAPPSTAPSSPTTAPHQVQPLPAKGTRPEPEPERAQARTGARLAPSSGPTPPAPNARSVAPTSAVAAPLALTSPGPAPSRATRAERRAANRAAWAARAAAQRDVPRPLRARVAQNPRPSAYRAALRPVDTGPALAALRAWRAGQLALPLEEPAPCPVGAAQGRAAPWEGGAHGRAPARRLEPLAAILAAAQGARHVDARPLHAQGARTPRAGRTAPRDGCDAGRGLDPRSSALRR